MIITNSVLHCYRPHWAKIVEFIESTAVLRGGHVQKMIIIDKYNDIKLKNQIFSPTNEPIMLIKQPNPRLLAITSLSGKHDQLGKATNQQD